MVFAEALTEYLTTGLSERIAETEPHQVASSSAVPRVWT